MNSISIEDLYKLDNPLIIDIRYKYDYNKENIPSSINIPYYSLERNYIHYLNRTNNYYLYCDYGYISKALCNKLSKLKYNTINIKGGYNSYKKYKEKNKTTIH